MTSINIKFNSKKRKFFLRENLFAQTIYYISLTFSFNIFFNKIISSIFSFDGKKKRNQFDNWIICPQCNNLKNFFFFATYLKSLCSTLKKSCLVKFKNLHNYIITVLITTELIQSKYRYFKVYSMLWLIFNIHTQYLFAWPTQKLDIENVQSIFF